MSVKNRLTKYKLKINLNFLQRLWTDPRSYSKWPSNEGHCIFENKLLHTVCISALYPDQLQSRHSPGTSTHSKHLFKWCCSTFHTIPWWKRTLLSQCFKVLLWETETKVLSPSSFCHLKAVPLPLPLSSASEKEKQQSPVPQCCSEAWFHKVLLQSQKRHYSSAAVAMSELQRWAPHGLSWDTSVQIQEGWELSPGHTSAAPSQQLCLLP